MHWIRTQSPLLLGIGLLAVACGGSDSTGLSTGSVQVTASTAGTDVDPDGYTVAVDGGAGQSLAVNGSVTFSQLSAGDHTVALSGMAANCTTSAQNPRTVSVSAGATAQTAFQIACARIGMIAFVSGRDGNAELYVMNADGTGVKRLTNNTANDVYPAWSPDGSRIAFNSDRDVPSLSGSDIYLMNADGSSVTRLTYSSAGTYSEQPSWSPDGLKIAFRGGDGGGYVMNADGSGVSRLTTGAFEPVWSPDGSKIAFVGSQDVNSDIYVMNADGTSRVNLTNSVGVDECGGPDWSPDGSKIVFAADSFGNGDSCRSAQLYVMNSDGTALRRLMGSSAQDMWPSWSPDGTKIAFTSNRDGYQEVYVMNVDGTGLVNLTKNPANDFLPVWRP